MPLIITRIEIYKINIPFMEPLRLAIGVLDGSNSILVRLWAGDRLCGLGEGTPASFITGETQETCFVAARALAPLLIGRDALDIEGRMSDLTAAFVGHSSVKNAFDMALYDLAARHARLPLYAFLGGAPRDYVTDLTVGVNTPEVMARAARAIVAADGLNRPTAIKVKLGTNRADDVARIRAIRAAVGDAMPLRIDANQGWDEPTAVATLQALAEFDIQYCEQPVAGWKIAALARVRSHSPIPIMADESLFDHHDAARLVAAEACDYFNIKLGKSGGIHTALKIAAIAEGAGIPCMIGCYSETLLGTSASAHLFAARRIIRFTDLDTPLFYKETPFTGGVVYDGPRAHLREDALGLGAEVDAAYLARLEPVVFGW